MTKLQVLHLVFVSIKYNRQDWITEFSYYGYNFTIHRYHLVMLQPFILKAGGL